MSVKQSQWIAESKVQTTCAIIQWSKVKINKYGAGAYSVYREHANV